MVAADRAVAEGHCARGNVDPAAVDCGVVPADSASLNRQGRKVLYAPTAFAGAVAADRHLLKRQRPEVRDPALRAIRDRGALNRRRRTVRNRYDWSATCNRGQGSTGSSETHVLVDCESA